MDLRYDAIVVGAGPNGLTAAAVLARAGMRVLVREAQPTYGGGARTLELTLPGYRHDLCSAVHPFGAASPVFRSLALERHGLEWIEPELPLAHPFDDGSAAVVARSIADTTATLDRGDALAWAALVEPLSSGVRALRSARGASRRFRGPRARALLAGIAAHAAVPLDEPMSMAFVLGLAGTAHTVGWPVPRGGAGRITEALAAVLRAHGGTIETDAPVRDVDELDADLLLLDVSPRQLDAIAGHRLPARYRRRLRRFRYGPGAFKLDWVLSEPVPWRAPACRRAGTIHLGASWVEIAASESAPYRGKAPTVPYVLMAQPSLWDDSRAPNGHHTLWAYCHVPNGSTVDMTTRVEAQIERFAPGFRDTILARSARGPRDMEAQNANMVGGDLYGGANIASQVLFRPFPRLDPYRVPVRGRSVWLCSASTPPGGGVHGMCGYLAAQAALRSC